MSSVVQSEVGAARNTPAKTIDYPLHIKITPIHNIESIGWKAVTKTHTHKCHYNHVYKVIGKKFWLVYYLKCIGSRAKGSENETRKRHYYYEYIHVH